MPAMRLALSLACIFCFVAGANGMDWLKGYTIEDGSQSPDYHYAILVPFEGNSPGRSSDTSDYVADLNTHSLLGKLVDISYEGQKSPRKFFIDWSPDSSFCVVQYYGQYGFYSVAVVQLQKNGIKQTEIGGHIQKMLNEVIAKESNPSDNEYECNAHGLIQIDKHRKIHFRIFGTTNPARPEDGYYAFFRGTYDVDNLRWEKSVAEPINAKSYSDLVELTSSWDEPGTNYSNSEPIAKSANEKMDKVLAILRSYLPAEEFEKVQSSQMEWQQKQRDPISSLTSQIVYFRKRIETLQEKIWWEKDETH